MTGPSKRTLIVRATLATLLVALLTSGLASAADPGNPASDTWISSFEKQVTGPTGCREWQITITLTGAEAPDKPMDVVFVIDRSGSMSGTYLANVKTAVKAFIDRMDFATDQDRVAIVSYAWTASVDYALGNNATSAKAAVDSLSAIGGTCIDCGMDSAASQLPAADPNRNRAVVVLSDGVANVRSPGGSSSYICRGGSQDPNCPMSQTTCMTNPIADAATMKASGASVFSIGYRLDDISPPCPGNTESLAQDTLVAMSSGSGHYLDGDPSNIDQVYETIRERIDPVGTNVSLTDVVASQFTIVPGSDSPSGTIASQTISWDIGLLGSGETQTYQFKIQASPGTAAGAHDTNTSATLAYTDPNGTSRTLNISPHPQVTVPPPLVADAGPDQEYQGTDVQIGGNPTASGGMEAYTYAWNRLSGDAVLSCTGCANPMASANNTSVCEVTVTDANGCPQTDTVEVQVNPTAVRLAGFTAWSGPGWLSPSLAIGLACLAAFVARLVFWSTRRTTY